MGKALEVIGGMTVCIAGCALGENLIPYFVCMGGMAIGLIGSVSIRPTHRRS